MTLALVLIVALAAYWLGRIRGYRKAVLDVQLALLLEATALPDEVEDRLEAQRLAARDGRN